MKKILKKNLLKFLSIGIATFGLVSIPLISSIACSSNNNKTNNKPLENNPEQNNNGNNNGNTGNNNNNIPGNNNNNLPNNKPNNPLVKPKKLINYTSNEFIPLENINYLNKKAVNDSSKTHFTFVPNTFFVNFVDSDKTSEDYKEEYKLQNNSFTEQVGAPLMKDEIFMADRVYFNPNDYSKPLEEQHFVQRAVVYKLSVNIKEFALYMTNCWGSTSWLNNANSLNVWKFVPEMNFEIYFYDIHGFYLPYFFDWMDIIENKNPYFELQTYTDFSLPDTTIFYGPNPEDIYVDYECSNSSADKIFCEKFRNAVLPILSPFLKNNNSINYNYGWWDNEVKVDVYGNRYSGPFNNYFYGFRLRSSIIDYPNTNFYSNSTMFGICLDKILFQPDQQNQINWFKYDNNNTESKNALKLDIDLFDYENYKNIRNFYTFEAYSGWYPGINDYQTYIVDYLNNQNLNSWSITPFKFLEVEIIPNEPGKVITDYTF